MQNSEADIPFNASVPERVEYLNRSCTDIIAIKSLTLLGNIMSMNSNSSKAVFLTEVHSGFGVMRLLSSFTIAGGCC